MRRRTASLLFGCAAAVLPLAHAQTTSTGSSGDTLITPTIPSISFFWSTYNDNVQTIPQCAGFQVQTYNNTGAAVQPTAPFYFSAFPIDYHPATTPLGDVGIGEWFTWSAAYPVGTRLSLGMTDSGNNSGGLVDGYTIVPGYTNCTVVIQDPSPPLSFTAYPDNNACDEVVLRINGGDGPFTVSVLAGQSGQYANVTNHDSRRVNLRNTVPAGQTFHIFVTDSKGASSRVSSAMTSSLHLGNCVAAAIPSSGSSTPIGAIVGGVVGGVLGAVLLGLLAWWLMRRRNRKHAEQADASGAFRQKGKHAAPSTVGEGARPDPDEGDSPHYSDSYEHASFKYPSPTDMALYYPVPTPMATSNQPVLPMPPSPYESAALHPSYPHPYDPYGAAAHAAASYSASSGAQAVEGGGYSSYDPMSAVSHTGSATSGSVAGSYDPNLHRFVGGGDGGEGGINVLAASQQPKQGPPAAAGIEELARPEEFEYRIGESPTRTQQYPMPPWPRPLQQQQQQPPPNTAGAYGPPQPPRLHSQSSQASMAAVPPPGTRLYP
ncbi:hypothetical protein JCM8115_005211 [Rhodotorula mucilaginosa]